MKRKYISIGGGLIVAILIIVFSTGLTDSSSIEERESPEYLIEKFFKDYKNNSDKAVNNLMNTNSNYIDINNSDNVELKNQLEELKLSLGKYYGNDPLTTNHLTSNLILYTYLANHDLQPLRFKFVFYRAEIQWRLFSFKFDLEYTDEINETSNLIFQGID